MTAVRHAVTAPQVVTHVATAVVLDFHFHLTSTSSCHVCSVVGVDAVVVTVVAVDTAAVAAADTLADVAVTADTLVVAAAVVVAEAALAVLVAAADCFLVCSRDDRFVEC